MEKSYIKHQVSYHEYFFLIALQYLIKMTRYRIITSPDLTTMNISYKVDATYDPYITSQKILSIIRNILSMTKNCFDCQYSDCAQPAQLLLLRHHPSSMHGKNPSSLPDLKPNEHDGSKLFVVNGWAYKRGRRESGMTIRCFILATFGLD